jgi:membrane-bound acyltransferase YfiQ involved in biofilm formation
MNYWFLAAAILSAFTCAVHVILGGRESVRPLLAATHFDHVAKFTNYYCWHLVTIAIATLAVMFAMAARSRESDDLAVVASAVALMFTLWNFGMIARHRLHPLQFPQWALFLPIACVGFAGVVV